MNKKLVQRVLILFVVALVPVAAAHAYSFVGQSESPSSISTSGSIGTPGYTIHWTDESGDAFFFPSAPYTLSYTTSYETGVPVGAAPDIHSCSDAASAGGFSASQGLWCVTKANTTDTTEPASASCSAADVTVGGGSASGCVLVTTTYSKMIFTSAPSSEVAITTTDYYADGYNPTVSYSPNPPSGSGSLYCNPDSGSNCSDYEISAGTTPAPTVTMAATPSTITKGSTSSLGWTSQNASSCAINGTSVALVGSMSVTPSTTTTYTITCTNSAGSANATATVTVVTPPLGAACYASPNPGTVNSPVTWYSTPSGGTSPYTYLWTGNGVQGATTQNVTANYANAATKTGSVTITDANNTTSSASCTDVVQAAGTPAAPLSATCSASPNPAATNATVAWSATVSGGTAPYSYAWYGNGVQGSTANPVYTSYANAATKTAYVVVTDSKGSTYTSPSCSDVVRSTAAPLSGGSCVASPNPANTNQTVTWTDTPSGGTPPYSYIWYGNGVQGYTGNPTTAIYANAATKTAYVTVTDSAGNSSNSSSCSDVVQSSGTGTGSNGNSGSGSSCTVSSTTASPGGSVTYNTTIESGYYEWESSTGSTAIGVSSQLTWTFPAGSSGLYGMSVYLPDGSQATCPTVTLGCGGTPTPTVSTSQTRVEKGASVTITYGGSNVNTSCILTDNGTKVASNTPNSCTVKPATYTATNIQAQHKFCNACDGGTPVCAVVNVVPIFSEF